MWKTQPDADDPRARWLACRLVAVKSLANFGPISRIASSSCKEENVLGCPSASAQSSPKFLHALFPLSRRFAVYKSSIEEVELGFRYQAESRTVRMQGVPAAPKLPGVCKDMIG